MPEVLELAHLVEQHRVAQVQVRRGRVESGLDAQRAAFLQAGFQLVALEQLVRPAGDQIQGISGGDLGHDRFPE